jgi:hypothetical protein
VIENISNLATSTLSGNSGSISSGASSFKVLSATGFPAGPARVIIGSEIIQYTTLSGVTFSGLTRGAEGTTAAQHYDNDVVAHVMTAGSHAQSILDTAGSGTYAQDAANASERTLAEKLEELPWTPEDFGALGNGTHDDTQACQWLAAALSTQGGGVVEIKNRYRITAQVTLPDNITMIQRDPSAGIVADCTGSVFAGNALTSFFATGVKFTGSCQRCFSFTASDGWIVEHCDISGATVYDKIRYTAAIYGEKVNNFGILRNTFHDNGFDDPDDGIQGLDVLIMSDYTHNVPIKDGVVNENRCTSACYINIQITDGVRCSANFNHCTGAKANPSGSGGYGVAFYGLGITCLNCHADFNTVWDCEGTGVYCGTYDYGSCVGNILTNVCTTLPDGEFPIGAVAVSGQQNHVGPNTINGCGSHGVTVVGPSNKIYVGTIKDCTDHGVYLRGPCDHSQVYDGRIENCASGVFGSQLMTGIRMRDIEVYGTTGITPGLDFGTGLTHSSIDRVDVYNAGGQGVLIGPGGTENDIQVRVFDPSQGNAGAYSGIVNASAGRLHHSRVKGGRWCIDDECGAGAIATTRRTRMTRRFS